MTTDGDKQPKPPLIQRIKAQNLLSFGPDGIDLELGRLNVLIGPNGSGKSNLLDAISLFQAAPRDLATSVRKSGGVQEWIWKGNSDSSALIEGLVTYPLGRSPLSHQIVFSEVNQSFRLTKELLYHIHKNQVEFLYQHVEEGRAGVTASGLSERPFHWIDIALDQSILSQLKDPLQFPEFDHLSRAYERFRLYREWQLGRGSFLRQARRVDERPNPLEENFSNLALFLGWLKRSPKTKSELIEKLADVYDGITDFELNIEGGVVQIYFTEGEITIPATRISDGTLRYLCLLAILLDPDPPPFIAIEEPELGIHPDLMPKIVDLLVDASTRTQLVVTTHNDTIVDALNDQPEAVLVCEKHDGQTQFNRLDREDLKHWMEKYRLGDLWIKGAIGGTRW